MSRLDRVGISLWTMQSTAARPGLGRALYRRFREDVLVAEELGFDSIWVGEHRVWYCGWCPAPLHALAAAAATTTRIRLGTAMYLVPQHEPVSAARATGLACSAPYYGGGMPGFISEKPRVPTMCHFGELDQSPTLEQSKAIAKAHPEITAHFYPGAGHGFNCDQRGSYHAASATLARSRTLEFFRKHLG